MMRVLIVDDDPDMLDVLSTLLAESGYEPCSASDGAAGLEELERKDIRIIISDWNMPRMDGIELCRAVRSRDQQTYRYFILTTVRQDRDDYLAAMAAGADDFLSKPVDTDMLLARLGVAERILELRQEVQQLRQLLPICMYCQKVRTERDDWVDVGEYVEQTATLSHGMCPTCFDDGNWKK